MIFTKMLRFVSLILTRNALTRRSGTKNVRLCQKAKAENKSDLSKPTFGVKAEPNRSERRMSNTKPAVDLINIFQNENGNRVENLFEHLVRKL